MVHLGENFSLAIKEPEYIVTTGPYRFAKHPMYIGSVMVIVGVSILSVHIAVIIVSILFFADRAMRENIKE